MTTHIERQSARAWPLALGLTLAAGVAVSVAFLVVAANQPPDLMQGDMWRSGSEVNALREALARGEALGWGLELRAERAPEGARVVLTPSSHAAPIGEDARVSLERARPGRADFDADVPLTRAGDSWVGFVTLPLRGQWRLHARVSDGDALVERDFALERNR
jgi:hypothetical protein